VAAGDTPVTMVTIWRLITFPADEGGGPAVIAEIELPEDWQPVIGLFGQPDMLLVRAWAAVQRAFGVEPNPEKAGLWLRLFFSLCASQNIRLGLRLRPDGPIERIDCEPLDGWHEDYWVITINGELVHRQTGVGQPGLHYKATKAEGDRVAPASDAVAPAPDTVASDSPPPTPTPKTETEAEKRRAAILAAFEDLPDELVLNAPNRRSLYEAVRDKIPKSRTTLGMPAWGFDRKTFDRVLKEPFEEWRLQGQKVRVKRSEGQI